MAQGDYDPNAPLIDPGQEFFTPPYQSNAAPGSGSAPEIARPADAQAQSIADASQLYQVGGQPNPGDIQAQSGWSPTDPATAAPNDYTMQNMIDMANATNAHAGQPLPGDIAAQAGMTVPTQQPMGNGSPAPEVKIPGFGGNAGPEAMAAGPGYYVDSHGQFHSDNDGANIRANRPFAGEGFSVGPDTMIDRGAPHVSVGSPQYDIPTYGQLYNEGKAPNLYGYGETGMTPDVSVPIPGYQPSQGPADMNYIRNRQDQINQGVPTGQGGFPTQAYGAPMQVAIPGYGGQQNGPISGIPSNGNPASAPGAAAPAQGQGQGTLTPNQRIQINGDGSVQIRDASGYLAPKAWSEWNNIRNVDAQQFDPMAIDKLIAASQQTVDPQLRAQALDLLSAHPMDFWQGKGQNGGAFGTDIFAEWNKNHTAEYQKNGIPGQHVASYAGTPQSFETASDPLKNLIQNAMSDNVQHRVDGEGNFFYTDPATGKEVGPISQAQQPRLLDELMAKKQNQIAAAQEPITSSRPRSTYQPPPPQAPPTPQIQIPGWQQQAIDMGRAPGQAQVPY